MNQSWLLEIFEGSGWQGEPEIKFKSKYSGFSLTYEYYAFLFTPEFQRRLIEVVGELEMINPETGRTIKFEDLYYDGYEINEDEGTITFRFNERK